MRVLLIEDSDHDWLAFRRACQSLMCDITRSTRAEEALALISMHADNLPFDLVVTDYKLPGMSGLEFCAEILEQEVSLPLVLLTGAGSEPLAVKALKMGVSDYIVKDVNQGYLSLLPVVLPEVVRRHEEHLARQRAEAMLITRNRQLALINRVAHELTSRLDLQEVIERLLYAVTETLNAEGASLWLVQHAGEGAQTSQKCLICRGFCNIVQDCGAPEELSIPFDVGVVGWVAQHGESTVVDDVSRDSRFYPGVDALTGLTTQSILAVPLKSVQRDIGVLEVVNKQSGTFADDVTFMETLTLSAVIALDNAQLVETLRHRNEELESALRAIKTLSGLVPICAWCGSKIQDEQGRWVKVESYVEAHSEAEFTHGICPDCLAKLHRM